MSAYYGKMVSGRFSAPNVSPGEGKRLDMNSLDGETAAEVWVGEVASGGEPRDLLIVNSLALLTVEEYSLHS